MEEEKNKNNLAFDNFQTRDFFISRIRAGFIKIDDIYVYHPSVIIEYEANEIYIETLKEAISEGLLTEKESLIETIKLGIWTKSKEEKFEAIPKHIEDFKVGIYNSYFKSSSKEKIRSALRIAEREMNNLVTDKHFLYQYTAESVATLAKNLYIFENCTKKRDGSPVDYTLYNITDYINKYNSKLLLQNQIRVLSRTTPWVNIYFMLKKNGSKIFENQYLSIEQQILLQWSSLYENMKESPDCPPDDMIQDDDAIDGWLIINSKSREKNKGQSIIDKLSEKVSGAHDIFLMAETPEDAKKVMDLNNERSKQIAKDRIELVKKFGIVKEQNLKDQKERIFTEQQQQLSRTMRNISNG